MPYEIDFHSVGNGAHSGDAITMRYQDGPHWRVLVIDGGYQADGERIVDHVRRTYGTEVVDHVVSTHPDNDHIGGLSSVLTQLTVRNLWIHVPFLHAEAILGYFQSSRWTIDGLRTRLKTSYPVSSYLLDLARQRNTFVGLPFEGTAIGPFRVLSPSQPFYEGLLPQFRDTPQEDRVPLLAFGHLIPGVGRRVARSIQLTEREDYCTETLLEGGTTAAENESSVVLGGVLDGRVILLTADAGLRALEAAADYAELIGLPISTALGVLQVPHHGSRNNISPSMLDRLVGRWAQPDSRAYVNCVVSAAPNDRTHPRQVVVNALIRRGLRPLVTRSGLIRCFSQLPLREGMVAATPVPFEARVEAYD